MHREELTRHIKSFTEPNHQDFKTNSPFVAFICWAQNFCEYAIKILLATEEQVIIDALEKQKEQLQDEITLMKTINGTYKEMGMQKWY